jgi:CRP-like cAMP-binding protein
MILANDRFVDNALPTITEVIRDRDARRRLFRSLPLFSDVDPNVCHRIADNAEHIHRRSGHEVIVQGDSARNAYLLLTGLVHINRRSDTCDNYHLCYQGPGQVLGMINVVSDERHKHTMRLVKSSDLMLIDREQFMDAFDASPNLRRNVMRQVNQRFCKTSDRLQQYYRLIDKESRFLVEILDILEASTSRIVAEDHATEELVIDWLSNDRAADRLGCDPRTVSYAKQRLKVAGLITTCPRSGAIRIKTTDFDTLQGIQDKLDVFNLQSAVKLGMKRFPPAIK